MFDFRQIKYTFARKPGMILRCARLMLGVSQKDVLQALETLGATLSLERYQTIENDIDGRKTGATEWFLLCECLGISYHAHELGYCFYFHIMKVRSDLYDHKFLLPITPLLQTRLEALKEWEELKPLLIVKV